MLRLARPSKKVIRAYIAVEGGDSDGILVRCMRVGTMTVERAALGIQIICSTGFTACAPMIAIVWDYSGVETAFPVIFRFRSVRDCFGGIEHHRDMLTGMERLTRGGSSGMLQYNGDFLQSGPCRLVGGLDA